MLSLSQCQEMATKRLQEMGNEADERYAIYETDTIEKDWCFVFFWDSQEYIETGDEDYLLAGNAPIIVTKKSGEVRQTSGTAKPIDYYLNELENEGYGTNGRW